MTADPTICPYTNEPMDKEELDPNNLTEEHLTWHLDQMAARGDLVKHENGSYSLVDPTNN